jgi:NAD(P)-dependent dehydrogenase (short-subunit alcohol dehydrogenase family)
MTDLEGRVGLVTGASSGLGRRFAMTLAGAGAAVAVAARRVPLLDPLVEEIRAAGGKAAAVPMDVTDEASVIAAFDAAQIALGPVDIVVANAGIVAGAPALDMEIEAFDNMVAVNLRGVFLTVREGARRMIAAGSEASTRGGRIVIVSSIGATTILPGVVGYNATKAGSMMLGKALAREWVRKGVNVNILCPGYVETDLNRHWFESPNGQKQVARFPRQKLMGERDLDAALLFLCSDGIRAVTGSVLTVDDGQSL